MAKATKQELVTLKTGSIWRVGACGKRCYDEARAELMLKATQGMAWKHENRREQRKYFCERCQAYHLTSQPELKPPTRRQP